SSPRNIPLSQYHFDRAHATWLLEWKSQPGQEYRIETSSDLIHWSAMDPSIMASESSTQWTGSFLNHEVLFLRVRQ
ncbi:MAG: hypothetical protein VXX94_08250, partial [Verrucomicrobiota bacterium]|nr:hypothetical protein [Verrucomicrobiota bacterium]